MLAFRHGIFFNVVSTSFFQRCFNVILSTLFQRLTFNVVSTSYFQRCYNVTFITKFQRHYFNVDSTLFQRHLYLFIFWYLLFSTCFFSNVVSTLKQRWKTSWPDFNLISTLFQRCTPAGTCILKNTSPMQSVTYTDLQVGIHRHFSWDWRNIWLHTQHIFSILKIFQTDAELWFFKEYYWFIWFNWVWVLS